MAKDKRAYRQMNEELAELMAWFESEEVDLDKAVIKYEQAVKLLGEMESHLKTAENKIIQLKAKLG